mgnify:CR=1 FL=1
MPSMNVSMPPELIKMVEGKVAAGFYNDVSDVVCDALRQADLHAQLIYQMKLDRLKAALAEGIEQVKNGDVVEFTMRDIIDELDAKQ